MMGPATARRPGAMAPTTTPWEMYNELYNGSVTCEEMRSLWAGTLLGDSVVFFGCPERGFGDEPYNHLYNHRPLSDFPAVFGPAKLDS